MPEVNILYYSATVEEILMVILDIKTRSLEQYVPIILDTLE